MAYPFFSLAKSKRVTPIDFRAGTITIRVEALPEHCMATIWDADVLIWAASRIVEARDAGLKTSRLMAATPTGPEFAFSDDEPDDEVPRAIVLRRQVSGVACQAAMDPGDGIDL